ncbi:MAG: cation acetate symporter [Roseibacillus sp.]|jgi:cation/acetate symporter|nr:cation acetate symporter [Roseibacillus sp.]MCP4730742.1 cation acetate symporter [Roseibacillus sp.]MDP7105691.1 cation acetate symporter [Roseibacillus sp.]MDP7308436.1 cation acetate symporter [Roseibacillus sp.]MDP7654789.1 cation acetate symporter [Roseibacillus sp.]|tara:strand:- start:4678 stop:6477 length:1800 start_codon:yes stop_codon:yes gene_type:complete
MDVRTWTFILVGLSFALYIGIAIRSRATSTGEFYVAGKGVPSLANGMATAADWMSAASFISMAGLISFMGRDGAMYLMGWTGGYVLLALLLAPYLRRFGKFTVPDFIGDRYYSNVARVVAVLCAVFVSFTYVAGQMRGVGVVFSRFLEVDVNTGVIVGMCIVLIYAVLGGMKGITYTQVAQYCVLIFAYLVPAIFISIMLTGNPVPQLGLGANVVEEGVKGSVSLLDKLNGLSTDLGFKAYTDGQKSTIDIFFITAALMVGTAGLPHVIVRFYTVKRVRDARMSAFWALLFIAILYTVAPAVGVFARTNLLETIPNKSYASAPEWFKNWEDAGLIAWIDKNGDGKIQYTSGNAMKEKPQFQEDAEGQQTRGEHGQRLLKNKPAEGANELYVDRDIMVLANPEIAGLPNWVIALVAAGGLAAALSTAAGLLLVISTSVAHDLIKRTINPEITEKGELWAARLAAAGAVVVAGYFGINPPGFVAQVVAFAFGLAASSFFPAIILGIFWKRANLYGVITGMIVGILFTSSYIIYFKFINPAANNAEHWLFGISPEGIGTIGMILNVVIACAISMVTKAPPREVQEMVDRVRYPRKSFKESDS